MPNDPRDARADTAPMLLAWGPGHDSSERSIEEPVLWLTGGATLLLWTALSLVLTA